LKRFSGASAKETKEDRNNFCWKLLPVKDHMNWKEDPRLKQNFLIKGDRFMQVDLIVDLLILRI
jgi:hypothetical protein